MSQVTLFQSDNKCKAVDILFIYTLVIFVSEIEGVRFLIRQQLVHKYPTPALSTTRTRSIVYIHKQGFALSLV